MVGNILQTNFKVVTGSKGVVTGSNAFTGTFASSTTGTMVNGTGTSFKTELQIGDYLYSTTTNECRRINKIFDNNSIGLDKAFSANITTDAVIVARRSFARSIVIKDSGTTGTSLIDNVLPFNNGYAQSFNNSESGINAMTYDTTATGAQLDITFCY